MIRVDLRTRIFLRALGLLAVLILAVTLVSGASSVVNQRRYAQTIYQGQVRTLILQMTELVLWDDRVALDKLISEVVDQDKALGYAFLERDGKPYVYTFSAGVPRALLGLGPFSMERAAMTPFQDQAGRQWLDIAQAVPADAAVLHLGVDVDVLFWQALADLRGVLLASGAALLAGALLAWNIARATTREVAADEAALRESVAFQNSLLNAIPIPVFYMDRDGRYLGFNKAYGTFFGATNEQLIGKTVFDVSPRELAEIQYAKDAELLESGGMQQYESRARNTHGMRDVIFSAATFADRSGNTGGLIGAILDITERKQAESMVRQLNAELEARVLLRTAQLEAANKELEEFSYSMSHDLRTPLRALDGFSKILEEEHGAGINDEGKRLLGALRDNAQRMGRLIDDILHFLSIGRRTMEYGAVDIAKLAAESFSELQAAAPQRRLRLALGVLPAAWGDRELIRQVVANLLANAVKYSATDGEALIEMGADAGEAEDRYYVRDHGVGFDMRYVDKLFKVFERVHPTGRYQGSGIGLAIVKHCVERHGGRVWAEGKTGEGATFHFTLPHRS